MAETTAVSGEPATGPSLRERWESVCGRVAEAARRSGRSPKDVVLVVVSKTASLDQIRELLQMGQVDFGENRVQQLVQRAAAIEEFLSRRRVPVAPTGTGAGAAFHPAVRWHMIGALQRNKVRKCVELVRLVHSVDSLRLAEEIQVAAARREQPVEILVEVNVAGERSKHGIAPAAARHLIDQIDTMINLRPRGLMCMAPLAGGLDAARRAFDRCRDLFDDIRQAGSGGDRFDILSMGMSADFEVGIECGANVVRVGSAVFGAPALQDPMDEQ